MGNNDRQQSAKEDRKAARASASGEVAAWRGYVNVSLNEQQKREFEDWARTDDAWLALAEAAASGCVVGLKYLQGEACFLGSLTQRTPGHVNAGLCVTARSKTADVALLRVLFLYRVLGSDGSWEKVQAVAEGDRW